MNQDRLVALSLLTIEWECVRSLDYESLIHDFASKKARKKRMSSCKNRGTVSGYFLAGRNMNFILVGASLFASNIGSGHFVGLAGTAAASGIGVSVFENNGLLGYLLLGWLFLPVYIASGVYTMPEYLRKRFGGQRIRVYLAVLALLLSIFTKVATDLYAGAIFINVAFNWNLYAAIGFLLAIAAVFTIAGGLTAVIWTDFIQTFVMLIGATYLCVVSFVRVGGYESIRSNFLQAASTPTNNTTTTPGCLYPPEYSFRLFRPVDADLPWPGVFFGLTIAFTWYCCTDQVIVQRVLAAKNLTHAKAGCVLTGYLKFLPMWLMVFPGMISRILYPDEVACSDAEVCQRTCGTETGCTNIAYPLLVIRLMPSGARGLMLAVMMSALMSSLTSIFNSSSTIFTMDIWTRLRRNPNDMELMIVGRVFVLLMVVVSILWVPVIQRFSQLFHYAQSVTSFLAPPICAVYVMAVLWKRTNEQGAFWGLMCGLAVGITRFIWESLYQPVPCGVDDGRSALVKLHYLYFAIVLFGIVVMVTVVISLLTKPIDDVHLVRLTFWNRFSKDERVDLSYDELEQMKNSRRRQEQPDNSSSLPLSRFDEFALHQNYSKVKDAQNRPGWWRTAVMWICGIERYSRTDQTHNDELDSVVSTAGTLDEKWRYKILCDLNALLLITFTVFLWAFFS